MGAALAVKPLLLPAAIPVGWWLWSRRRVDHLAIAVGAAIALWFASALPWGLGNVWRQSVTYNSGAGPRYAKLAQLRKLFSTLGSRDLLVVGALILASAHGARRLLAQDRRRPAADVTVLAVWTVVDGRSCSCSSPRSTATTSRRSCRRSRCSTAVVVRSPRVLLVVLVLLLPWSVHNLQSILRPAGYRGDEAALMIRLKALPSDAQAISDDPGFVYRAGLSHAEADERRLGQAHRPASAHDRVGRAGPRPTRASARSSCWTTGSVAICPASRRRSAAPGSCSRPTPTAACARSALAPSAAADARRSSGHVGLPARAVEAAQDRHAVDHRAERHHLGRDGEQDQADQHEVARAAADVEHDRQAEHARRARWRRCRRASGARAGRRRAARRTRRSPVRSRCRPRRRRATNAIGTHASEPDLDRATRRAVEQVREIRGERDEHRIGEQPPARHERHVRRRARARPRRRRRS